MNSSLLRVVIVDDNEDQLSLVARTLRNEGFEVSTTSTPFGVSNLVLNFEPDVVLIDVNIPALSGDRILGLLRNKVRSEARLVLFSANDESELRALAHEIRADGWIQKGMTGPALAARLRSLCRQPAGAAQ